MLRALPRPFGSDCELGDTSDAQRRAELEADLRVGLARRVPLQGAPGRGN